MRTFAVLWWHPADSRQLGSIRHLSRGPRCKHLKLELLAHGLRGCQWTHWFQIIALAYGSRLFAVLYPIDWTN